MIFRSFYVSICSTVIKISVIYITSSRISSPFVHISLYRVKSLNTTNFHNVVCYFIINILVVKRDSAVEVSIFCGRFILQSVIVHL